MKKLTRTTENHQEAHEVSFPTGIDVLSWKTLAEAVEAIITLHKETGMDIRTRDLYLAMAFSLKHLEELPVKPIAIMREPIPIPRLQRQKMKELQKRII